MKKLFVLLCTFALIFGAVGVAIAMLVDFDDIDTGGSWMNLSSSYQGFTWGGDWEVVSNSYYKNTYGNSNDFPSNPNAAYNGYDDRLTPTVLYSDVAFDLIGGSFSSWASCNSYSSAFGAFSLVITGYLADTEIGSVTLSLSAAFEEYDIGLLGVDQVVFNANPGNFYWLADNLTINPVPEPATMLLLASGLGGLAAFRRKIKKR